MAGSAEARRVMLRGVERMLTMVDGVSMKIVHSMLVAGDAETLLQFLPVALLRTFNMHPCMRALQVKDEDLTAEIQAPVTIDDIASKDLLRVRRFSQSESPEGTFEDWQAYAEAECDVGFDRYTQFPFFLVVWIDHEAEQARLMLFSDHYMSDGRSGMAVLNCILEQVSALSDSNAADNQAEELPLRPSFYEMWLSKNVLYTALLKGLMAFLGATIYRGELRKFKPVLPARDDQHDFVAPPVANPSSASFAQGEPARIREALAACREHGATFGGALVAAVTLAFYRAAEEQPDFKPGQPFKVQADLDFNMRQRLPCPIEENQVGVYIASTDLAPCSEGVDVKTTQFWDLARRAKKEIDGNLRSTFSMDAVAVVLDQKINAKIKPSLANYINIRHSQTSDANISNVGRYPYSKELSLASEYGNQSKLAVKNLHVYNPIPHLGPSAVFFVTSVDSFCHSMGHKCDDAAAKTLFTAWVASCEKIANIKREDTLVDVLDRLGL
ncbi:hypothetical protein PHYSODRAFT_319376 [Phytophthora sojae]|uniref:Condensation domain-containing protein n=1 Tax=Phytophthora sojae (strain P6497) TaxID=1094619 RepID=G5AAM3_PHYSP|nr:hypothetical protein PHYSODRAFT_319376 [Phytophthora sojae]EGZ07652.1 hypothetical protein PHYSODRAFT_319376 [Phytophthora sojae]|eukprot:XP_009537218.1 hypothetical protein PHYSODRAFT_319376 [Phytophthora sojae]